MDNLHAQDLFFIDDYGGMPGLCECVWQGEKAFAIVVFSTKEHAHRYGQIHVPSYSPKMIKTLHRRVISGKVYQVDLIKHVRAYAKSQLPRNVAAVVIDPDAQPIWVSVGDIITAGLQERRQKSVIEEITGRD